MHNIWLKAYGHLLAVLHTITQLYILSLSDEAQLFVK